MFIKLPLHSHNQPNTQKDVKKYFLVNGLIHLALIIGVVIFGGVAFLISAKSMSFTPNFDHPVIWVAVFACVFTIGLSFVIPRFYRKINPAPTSPRSALQQYQMMCLIRWAVIEAGAFLAGIAIIVTRNILPLGLFVISVAYLISRYPSQKEFVAFTEDEKG